MKLNELRSKIRNVGTLRTFDKNGDSGVKELRNKKIVYVPDKYEIYNLLAEQSVNVLKEFSGNQFILVPNGSADNKCTAYYFHWGYGGNLDYPVEIEFK